MIFGCDENPANGSSYCSTHFALGGPNRVGTVAHQVLRHRHKDGRREYKMEGSASWVPRESVPVASMEAYEISLAEKADRRQRRRGAPVVSQSSSSKVDDNGEENEKQYHDTENEELKIQSDDVNPCSIDKVLSVPCRRYGGLLVATLPCGRVVGMVPLAGGESLAQVSSLLSTLVNRGRRFKYVFYDNACALARYTRHPLRCSRTEEAKRLAQLTYVLDGLHHDNHTACLDKTHKLYMPEVSRDCHQELLGVNSQTCEQFFSWSDSFAYVTHNMHPIIFRTYLRIVAHWFNILVLDNIPEKMKATVHRRSIKARNQSKSKKEEAQDGVVVSDAPESPTVVTLRRNPDGVGLFGAGKFHWISREVDDRPLCKKVWNRSLSEKRDVEASNISFLSGNMCQVILPEGKSDVCVLCARNLRKEGVIQ